jgi:tRNA (guanine26-N2/guanine27-N2)-dimethyltransferase
MYSNRSKGLGDEAYDVIDVDPYGSCAPFIDAAVQCVADGGLMCITSTDMPVLGGNHPETCFARYGGSTLKTAGYIHEMALRVILHSIATAAAKYGREIRPLLSCSIDFYVRVFVQVFDSPARAKLHASRTGLVHQCGQCEAFYIQPLGEASEEEQKKQKGKQAGISADSVAAKAVKFRPARVITPGTVCDECSEGRYKVGGPLYISPIFDPGFVERCLSAAAEGSSRLPGVTSWKKLTSLLTAISEESNDVPLFYKLPTLCRGLKVNPVPLRQFRSTLKALGYQVSHFHREPEAVKTDAPPHVVYDLMRLWAEEHAPKNCPMPALLNKTIRLKRPFEWATGGLPSAKVPKFLPNPEANWGPKKAARGGGAVVGEDGAEDEADSERRVKAPI